MKIIVTFLLVACAPKVSSVHVSALPYISKSIANFDSTEAANVIQYFWNKQQEQVNKGDFYNPPSSIKFLVSSWGFEYSANINRNYGNVAFSNTSHNFRVNWSDVSAVVVHQARHKNQGDFHIVVIFADITVNQNGNLKDTRYMWKINDPAGKFIIPDKEWDRPFEDLIAAFNFFLSDSVFVNPSDVKN